MKVTLDREELLALLARALADVGLKHDIENAQLDIGGAMLSLNEIHGLVIELSNN